MRRLLPLLFACGSTQRHTALDDLEARMPKILYAIDSLVKDLDRTQEDCREIASTLRKWGSVWAVELQATAELKAKLTPVERERYEEDHDKDDVHVVPVLAVQGLCPNDHDVEEALKLAGFRR